jgi:hypothetical protein
MLGRTRCFACAGGLAAAIVLGLASQARALFTMDGVHYQPSYTDRFPAYRYATDLAGGVRFSVARICREECPERTRGVRMRSTEDGGFGFFQYGVEIGPSFDLDATIDVSRLWAPGAFAGIEFDSPFVPVGVFPPNFIFVAVERQLDGSLRGFARKNGVDVGTPVVLPPVESVWMRFSYANDMMTACLSTLGQPEQCVVTNELFVDDSSGGGLGAGMSLAGRGDQAGVAVEITGDVFDATRRALLLDLQTAIDKETEAQTALGMGDPATARTRLQEATDIVNNGTQIPMTDPPQFTGGLVGRTNSLFADNQPAAKEATKQLEKALDRDADAIDRIDRGRLEEAEKKVGSALEKKGRAKAVIETGAARERPL